MDRTDLIMEMNWQDEFLPFQRKVADVAQYLRGTGQIEHLRAAIADGATVESLADDIGYAWNVDADIVARGIRKALDA